MQKLYLENISLNARIRIQNPCLFQVPVYGVDLELCKLYMTTQHKSELPYQYSVSYSVSEL